MKQKEKAVPETTETQSWFAWYFYALAYFVIAHATKKRAKNNF